MLINTTIRKKGIDDYSLKIYIYSEEEVIVKEICDIEKKISNLFNNCDFGSDLTKIIHNLNLILREVKIKLLKVSVCANGFLKSVCYYDGKLSGYILERKLEVKEIESYTTLVLNYNNKKGNVTVSFENASIEFVNEYYDFLSSTLQSEMKTFNHLINLNSFSLNPDHIKLERKLKPNKDTKI